MYQSSHRYSPDFNPIEQSFAKLKGLLRKTQARTLVALWSAIGSLMDQFSTRECERLRVLPVRVIPL